RLRNRAGRTLLAAIRGDGSPDCPAGTARNGSRAIRFCKLLAASLPALFGIEQLPDPVCMLHSGAGCGPELVEAPHWRPAGLCIGRLLCSYVLHFPAENPLSLSSGGAGLEGLGESVPIVVVDDDVRVSYYPGPCFYRLADGDAGTRAVWGQPAGLQPGLQHGRRRVAGAVSCRQRGGRDRSLCRRNHAAVVEYSPDALLCAGGPPGIGILTVAGGSAGHSAALRPGHCCRPHCLPRP